MPDGRTPDTIFPECRLRPFCRPETQQALAKDDLAQIRRISALHQRLALPEMTNHEFLDKNYRKERTTFADGTKVAVDWDKKAAEISPDLKQ
jgi:hypothetical protein